MSYSTRAPSSSSSYDYYHYGQQQHSSNEYRFIAPPQQRQLLQRSSSSHLPPPVWYPSSNSNVHYDPGYQAPLLHHPPPSYPQPVLMARNGNTSYHANETTSTNYHHPNLPNNRNNMRIRNIQSMDGTGTNNTVVHYSNTSTSIDVEDFNAALTLLIAKNDQDIVSNGQLSQNEYSHNNNLHRQQDSNQNYTAFKVGVTDLPSPPPPLNSSSSVIFSSTTSPSNQQQHKRQVQEVHHFCSSPSVSSSSSPSPCSTSSTATTK